MVDVMHRFEIFFMRHVVFSHHAAHRCAVAQVIIFLDTRRLVRRHVEIFRDVAADEIVDLLPDRHVVRIERVVEIEHPGFDMGEAARDFMDGIVHFAIPGT